MKQKRKKIGLTPIFRNEVRLHSAIGLVTPMDRLTGLDVAIQSERKMKLQASRMNREKLFRVTEAKRSEAPTPSSFIGDAEY